MQKVFISDLHLGDGFFNETEAFEEDLVQFLDFLTSSGKEIELIIVGDALELLESRYVKELGLISFDEVLERIHPEMIDEIFNIHPSFVSALRRFLRVNRLTYIIGNHDYYFLKRNDFQEKFKELLTTKENIEFCPYHYDESHGIFAYHGSNFDLSNRFGKEKKTGKLIPPIGDYMARYMMINFQQVLVNLDVPEHITRDFDDVRPIMDVFDWFEFVTGTYNLSINLIEMWISEIIKMLKTVEAKKWIKSSYPKAQKFSNLFINEFGGVKFGRSLIVAVSKLRALNRTNYMKKRARQILYNGYKNPDLGFREKDFYGFCEMPEIDYKKLNGVIFAHRHKFDQEFIPINGGNKFYLNTGAWRQVIEKTKNEKGKKFINRGELSYIIIENIHNEVSIRSVTKNKIKNNCEIKERVSVV